ncbi:2OG-Fe(II) oxygenase [Sphingomonas crocodyli]|uniref:Proline hydroxylase n=1 Tax=Sphingomonas crocodyli TaxID=1979270 RepID=A0A437LWF1_9SPHN|nr:2OG-Fe(II) oxygenase [Sphingomonas crocodyli]RVT89722.1 proline hydroxylase [Sphingomonas crocodyli]
MINDRYDWPAIAHSLDEKGWAVLPALIDTAASDGIAALYGPSPAFRSHVVMARHGFGQGEYRYFAYPLPPQVAALRAALYPRLAPIANRWHDRMGFAERFPSDHAAFLDRCYGPGDYNCLHQDLYGDHVFPLQAAVLLSTPGEDFEGGEFILTEQRPRMQSRVSVVPLGKGDAVIFAVNARPRAGSRGDYRVTMRHGVSEIICGQRHMLGLIFHDAR